MDTPRNTAYLFAYAVAAQIIAEGRQHAPLLATYDATTGAPLAAVHLAGDPGQRGAVLRALRTACDRQTIYCYVDEGYMVKLAPGEPLPDTRPSQHPNRVEVVSFILFARDWEAAAHCPIRRPGNTLELARLQTATSSGRLSLLSAT